MIKYLPLIACLLAPPAQAAPALEPDLTYVVEQLGSESETLILMTASASGKVRGAVASPEGDILCDDSWQAQLQSRDGGGLQFQQIQLSPSPCVAQAALEALAEGLARVTKSAAGDEGIVLSDPEGQPVMYLRVGG